MMSEKAELNQLALLRYLNFLSFVVTTQKRKMFERMKLAAMSMKAIKRMIKADWA